MSWLRNSQLRASLGKRSTQSPPKDCDPFACYASFGRHWQQIYDIIKKTQPPKYYPNQDDVLSVVNHIDQMETILLWELKSSSPNSAPSRLEYLLNENILDKLFLWSLTTGKYKNAMIQEQLKLFEMLISNSGHELIGREPIARPLLKLLDSCNDCYPPELEKRLVILLNQLCVSLMHNIELLGIFFTPATDEAPAKFLIFSLLIPFVHQEGAVGQQARDALLLCMSVSQMNEDVGTYIAESSNICQFLASGLCGLYSRLPRKLNIEVDDWHRLTTDDVNELDELNMFMNSLEFCNAIALAAHPKVKAQLLKYLYQGFLVPVMGPALLQVHCRQGITSSVREAHKDVVLNLKGSPPELGHVSSNEVGQRSEGSNVEELIAATAYFELFLRSITEPCMLYFFIKFLIVDDYEGERILNILVHRLGTKSRLCLVSLALFETLVDLNCEDVMLELVLRYLIPCTHVMLSQRKRVGDMSTYNQSALKFLSLSPSCCSSARACASKAPSVTQPSPSSLQVHHTHDSLPPVLMNPAHSLPPMLTPVSQRRRAISGSEPHFASPSKTDSLYGNYVMYVLDAKRNVDDCTKACRCWAYRYNGDDPPCDALDKIKRHPGRNGLTHQACPGVEKSAVPEGISQGTTKPVSDSGCVDLNEAMLMLKVSEKRISRVNTSEESGSKSLVISDGVNDVSHQFMMKDGSQLSMGESSGYESFPFKESRENTPDNDQEDDNENEKPDYKLHELNSGGIPVDSSVNSYSSEVTKISSSGPNHQYSKESVFLDMYNTTPNIGPFMEILLKKLEGMMFNNLYINLHLTGLISRLAIYPQPLLHSFLLNHTLVFQPSIRSLFQVLESLKHKIESYLNKQENVNELILQAQQFLIAREERLVNVRKHVAETSAVTTRRTSVPEPFSRGDVKRESFSSRLSSVFKRATTSNNSHEKLQTNPDGSGYRYIHRMSWSSSESKDDKKELWNVVMSAVILDEWLKELAAITQEHFVMSSYPFTDIT
ncbi:FHF complex subunit HOOK interacting protein 1B isoform X2 [Ischnura elegans]|uniref:FHF complex subunit HOOK interacting protein 1B isoform X2 n=1 Tax=Ischnura elegans TaxID=197161 RepID=UPI001ED88C72|nr:FHF complex subunit HOOK interacting protein 1B isoform X2 [Ischnura elegans]